MLSELGCSIEENALLANFKLAYSHIEMWCDYTSNKSWNYESKTQQQRGYCCLSLHHRPNSDNIFI